jgi:acyl CoA:acetate/3-ketoacid CoA transferase alpha subunit
VGLDDVRLLQATSAANVRRVFTSATREEGQAGLGGMVKHKEAALGRAGALMGRGCAQANGLPTWVTQALVGTVCSPSIGEA